MNFLKVMCQNHWKCNYLMEFNNQVLLIPFISWNDCFSTECLILQREKQKDGKVTLQHVMLSGLYNDLGINNNSQVRKLKCKSFTYSSGSLSQSVQQLENNQKATWAKNPGVFTKCLQVRIQTHRGISHTASYLQADILQVRSVLPDDLLNEIGMSGLKIGSGWPVQLKLKLPPEIRNVKHFIPAPTHRRRAGSVY